MISYRDMTFCKEETCDKFGDGKDDCFRSLTPIVREEANKWWGGRGREEAPIAQFMSKPECYRGKK